VTEKQIQAPIWGVKDGKLQVSFAVYGGAVETFTMDIKTFHLLLGRGHEAYASLAEPEQRSTKKPPSEHPNSI
jgi:hypothetical protein